MISQKKYKHLFFDLDRTLWDFDKSSSQTLIDIIKKFKLEIQGEKVGLFLMLFNKYNDYVWQLYQNKEIKKEILRIERFRLTLEQFNVYDSDLITEIHSFYIGHAPQKSALIDGCTEILEYLYPKYPMYIVSNGFYDVQIVKMESSGILPYFKKIFTSDISAAAKPNKKIFEYALKSVNAKKIESLFIGDDPVNDIEGPKKFGIDQVWLQPANVVAEISPTFTIEKLTDLKKIL